MTRGNPPSLRARLELDPLHARLTPAAGGGYAVGVDDGTAGQAAVFDDNGGERFRTTPFGQAFTGGTRVAFADVTGDGTADLIAAAGPNAGSNGAAGVGPQVRVYDGTTGNLVAAFDAYEGSFRGGVTVAAADLNGDGKAEIVTGADVSGGPRARVFDGASVAAGSTSPTVVDDFLAIDDANFRGGIRLGLGDVNADGVADLVVGAGFGGGARVAAFDGAALGRGQQVKLFADFFAFEQGLRNGIYVGVGDVDGDGRGDVILGGGPGGAPRVRVASGSKLLQGADDLDRRPDLQLANFFAGDDTSRDGVRVGIEPFDDRTVRIVALDVASHRTRAFRADGTEDRQLGTGNSGKAGFYAGEPFDDRSGYTIRADDKGGSQSGGTGGTSGGATKPEDTPADVADDRGGRGNP